MPKNNIEPAIRTRAIGAIGEITFDRLPARNAISLSMARAAADACEAHDRDPAVRIITIRGAGEWFASGADLKELPASRETPVAARQYDAEMSAAVARVAACRKPTLALLNGPVLGGGLAFALACDMRVAARRCYIQIPVARNGLFYAPADSARLTRLVGLSVSKWMMMSGERVDSVQALNWGVVTAVYDDDAFDAETAKLLEKIAAGAPLSLIYTKLTLEAGPEDTAMTDEAYQRIYSSPDPMEGMTAIREKRAPVYRGDGD